MKRAYLTTGAGAALVALLAVATASWAGGERCDHGRWGDHAGMRGEHHMRMLENLDLTDDQRASIRQIMEAGHEELSQLEEQKRENQHKLMLMSPDEAGYYDVVGEVSQANGALTTQIIARRAQLRADVHALLTDEQKAKAAEMHEKMMDRHAERLERRMQHLEALKDQT